ncbi:MAG: hypothetical protein SNJ70_00110 [Armatimonadota bacterium]
MYQRGRLCRYYIRSFIRNAKNGEVLKGISWLNCAFLLSFSGMFSSNFWKALRD